MRIYALQCHFHKREVPLQSYASILVEAYVNFADMFQKVCLNVRDNPIHRLGHFAWQTWVFLLQLFPLQLILWEFLVELILESSWLLALTADVF